MIKHILTKNPSFSSTNRVGWEVEELNLKDEKGNEYKALRDKLGVSWPFSEEQIT